MNLLKRLRREVYRRGYRPPLGHPLHSPSLELQIVGHEIARALAEGILWGGASGTTGGVSMFTTSGTRQTHDGGRSAIRSALAIQPTRRSTVCTGSHEIRRVGLPSSSALSNPPAWQIASAMEPPLDFTALLDELWRLSKYRT